MRTKVLENKSMFIVAAVVLGLSVIYMGVIGVFAAKPETVTICHSTGSNGNPYVVHTPSKSADVGGHDGHSGPVWFDEITGGWGDIIPPFDYSGGSYPGKNWDADGQAFYNNACKIPGTAPAIDLAVTKTADNDTPQEGNTVTYTITVTNNGPDTATNVVVTDTVPAGTTFVSANPSEDSQNPLTWTFSSILSGDNEVILVQTTVDANTTGDVITNTASVDADETDTDSSNNSADESITVIKLGCTNPNAYNYDDAATQDDGSCTYDLCSNVEGLQESTDGYLVDGDVCTPIVLGCTDPEALNYSQSANQDDGSCEYQEPTGTIYVQKAVENSGATLFGFDVSWLSNIPSDFSLVGGEQVPFPRPTGSYTVSENNIPPGWEFVSVQCSVEGDVSSWETLGETGVAIDLVAGEEVYCTFTNRAVEPDPILGCTDPEALNYNPDATQDDQSCEYRDGGEDVTRIIVRKVTNIDTTDEFPFLASWTENFTLTGNSEESFDLNPGTYSVAEGDNPSGWSHQSTVCESSLGGFESNGEIDLSEGETVTCVTTNSHSTGGGGGGGGGGGSEPEPEVLGEQTEILPAAAPNTGVGAGGLDLMGSLSTLIGLVGLSFVNRKK